MKLLICVDDTDNLESRGTGAIAAEMSQIIESEGWGRCGFISRHQLVLHKDVRYTSHNSSMCFDAEIDGMYLDKLTAGLSGYLENEAAEGSDPGLCIADSAELNSPESSALRIKLIEFGYRAKSEVLTKEHAYSLAVEAGVFLDEFGGTGDGIIGALSGVGLRLHGNDGEVKGGIERLGMGMSFTAAELIKERLINAVCTIDMKPIPADDRVIISWKAKPVMYKGLPILLVIPVSGSTDSARWQTLQKTEMRAFGDERAVKNACSHFKPDVPEEIVSKDEHSCYNCVYRRWTEDSFECTI